MKSPVILHTITALDQFENEFEGSIFRGRNEKRVALVGRSNVGKSSLVNE
ncbi:MAG: YihA family ribosome biogenesis GTP-binding protein, partial [Proteobacteria bacterium]